MNDGTDGYPRASGSVFDLDLSVPRFAKAMADAFIKSSNSQGSSYLLIDIDKNNVHLSF